MAVNHKHAFTLIEVLVAVLIMAILVTLAVPMYDRMIEKSRLGEVTVMLKRLSEAKFREMDNRGLVNFAPNVFTIADLDISVPESENYIYSLYPNTLFPNAVCAYRKTGDTRGTTFLYLGEAAESCNCSINYATNTVCGGYCSTGRKLFCRNSVAVSANNGIAAGMSTCDVYGLDSYSQATCAH